MWPFYDRLPSVPGFEKAGIDSALDEGFIPLGNSPKGATAFVAACRKLRRWERERLVTT